MSVGEASSLRYMRQSNFQLDLEADREHLSRQMVDKLHCVSGIPYSPARLAQPINSLIWFEEGTLREEEAQWLVDRLTRQEGTRSLGEWIRMVRTLVKRRRRARLATFVALIDAARSRRHPRSDNLAGVAEVGVKIGTRPCRLIGARPSNRDSNSLLRRFWKRMHAD
jgi:hypothetical protein